MEIDQGLLTKVKNYLRISHTKLDDDVADTISACLTDLLVCGVRNPSEGTADVIDPLVLNAVKLYCKAEYTDDTGKAAEYMARYNSLKSCLMMANGYREESGSE